MSAAISNITIGRVDLVTPAGNYNQYGTTSNVVNVNEGGRYIEVKAESHNGVDLAAAVKELNTHIAAGCMHNSADRVDAPKCHEETRQAVQADIFGWVDDGSSDEVLWLTGPAGTGKSAIMGTIGEKMRENGRLVAAYYFSSFSGPLERQSKRGFVVTLAYQICQCEALDPQISSAILSAVQKDPAVFRMSLKEQMDSLILRPLQRVWGHREHPQFGSPMALVVDGVDECGEGQYVNSYRSREDDQLEVLSVLLHAIKDPAFPFRIIVASRPENWIRRFFTDAAQGRVHEIFLDDKYKPDDDIRLFLKSKFAELCRRHGINPSAWPTEDVLTKLVQDASGQFIYVATVLRFINTPPLSPREQLEIVLKIKPQDTSNPFAILDALYTSILSSTRSPSDTAIQLKALQFLESSCTTKVGVFSDQPPPRPSAWTVDRLFEGCSGSGAMLTELPSLVYICDEATGKFDSVGYGRELEISPQTPEVGWAACYTFYHKSFLDYLEGPRRCGAAFPEANQESVKTWIAGRLSRILMCGGPEVPIGYATLPVFQRCFLDILITVSCQAYRREHSRKGRELFRIRKFSGDIVLDDNILSRCEPRTWLDLPNEVPSSVFNDKDLLGVLDNFVHRSCTGPRYLCKRGCKLWTKAISDWKERQPEYRGERVQ